MADCIIVFGTASNVGKSWVCTALCATARARGIDVAPFKARNLSNNAAPGRTPSGGWGELGRAQAAQAEAAGLAPTTDMNPVLLKPGAPGRPGGTQLLIDGVPQPLAAAGDGRAWAAITAAHDRLADRHRLLVIEGAGSPVELNLLERDLANLPLARHAIAAAAARGHRARVLLVADIAEGGVFAAVLGTLALLPDDVKSHVCGILINRFQGDPAFFAPGPALLAARAGVPVLGVLPRRDDIHVDAEDLVDAADQAGSGPLVVAVLRLPTVASFDDLAALARVPGLALRFVDRAEAVGWPDLLLIPGARDPMADMDWLDARGLSAVVRALAAAGVPVLGICGGYQLLGTRIRDAAGQAGSAGDRPGLGLLPATTAFAPDKTVTPVATHTTGAWLLPPGLPVRGYEIHHGQTTTTAPPLLGTGCAAVGTVAGSYVHGLLDGAAVRQALVAALRARRGLPPAAPRAPADDAPADDAPDDDAPADDAPGAPDDDAARHRAAGHAALVALLSAQVDLDRLFGADRHGPG